MNLKTSVAAMILALSATVGWAGDTDQALPDMSQQGAAGMEQSSSPNAANEQLDWKYLNGRAASSENQGGIDQSALYEGQGASDHSANSADQNGSDEAAMTDGQSESDQSVGSADQSGSDQPAFSEGQGDSDQAAAPEDQSGTDQTANLEEQDGDDQSASSEDQNESDQSAKSDRPGADLKDKVVVIIPRGWKGSVPDLIAALKASPDAADIVVVQRGEPRASSSSDYSPVAKMSPAILR